MGARSGDPQEGPGGQSGAALRALSPPVLDPSVLPIFLLAVLALAIAPGPDLALIVSHALARGVRAGVVFGGHRRGRRPSDCLGGVRLVAADATRAGHRRRRAPGWGGLSDVDRDRHAHEGEA